MRKPRPTLPGKTFDIDSIIRVDQAGEMAAVEIYKAQRNVFKNTKLESQIDKQLEHQEHDELIHKAFFDEKIKIEKVRPTIFEPFFKPMAQLLGTSTALIGISAVHTCTAAVEEVIEGHYLSQEIVLNGKNNELKSQITKFKEEEIAHKNDAISYGTGHPILSNAIKTGCKMAIEIAHKF